MSSNRKKVMKWIEDNFDTAEITTQCFDLMPGGVIVKDISGASLLVYLDVMTDTVKFRLGGG